eukprot:952954-Rhodomonas_salina.1
MRPREPRLAIPATTSSIPRHVTHTRHTTHTLTQTLSLARALSLAHSLTPPPRQREAQARHALLRGDDGGAVLSLVRD